MFTRLVALTSQARRRFLIVRAVAAFVDTECAQIFVFRG